MPLSQQANISEETCALLILNNTPGLGPVKVRRLTTAFNTPQQVLSQSVSDLQQVEGIGPQLANNIARWEERPSWKEDLQLVERYGVKLLTLDDPSYPEALRHLSDAPPLLYMLGSLKPSDTQSVAVIGTRNASIYGTEAALTISRDLAIAGVTIVSGLARGIDTAAHQSTLDAKGRTLAVIGSGLARLYPPENRALARAIVASGAVLSEYPMTTPPDRQHFPQRNRIVSGISLATLLIEAPERSGALITMERAKKQGRVLFTLPGRIDLPNYRGNHKLLKNGDAQLIETAEEILEKLNLFSTPSKSALPSISLSEQEEDFLTLFSGEELSIDAIMSAASFPITKINTLLTSLILKKKIREYPGKVFKKIQ